MRVEVSAESFAAGNGLERKDSDQMSTRLEADLGYLASARKLQIFSADPNMTENYTLDDYYLIVQKNVIADMFNSMLCLSFNMLDVLLLASPECKQGFSERANASCHNFHTFEKEFYLRECLGTLQCGIY